VFARFRIFERKEGRYGARTLLPSALQPFFLSLLFPTPFLTPPARLMYDPIVEQSTGDVGCTEAGNGPTERVRIFGVNWCCLVLFGIIWS